MDELKQEERYYEIGEASYEWVGERGDTEFRLGAEWADKHPRKDLVEINKIYIWLSDFLDKCYIEDRSKAEEINADLVLKSFLKAAKGE